MIVVSQLVMPRNTTIRWLAVPILVDLLRVVTTGQTAAPATIWAAPAGETLCEDYALRVNGQTVPVYSCRVSAVPFNQVWPGYQRPIDQAEFAGFAHWGMSGPVSVEITSKRSFTNVKLVGLWRYNADGIDICNSQDVVIRNSFVRAFDDAIGLKGLNWGQGGFHDRPVRNVRVHNNVIWCDWGRALEIGAETSAPEIANVRFQDCDIIRTTHIAMDVQCGDRALVHDIRYENIRVETDDVCPAPRMQGSRDERYMEDPKDQYVPNLLVIVISKNPYSKDPERGNVRDVTYAGVSVTGRRAPRSFFNGLDAQHTVQGVTP